MDLWVLWSSANEENLKRRITSKYFPNLKLKISWINKTFQILQMKMIHNGRQPQIIGTYPNLKLKLRWLELTFKIVQMQTTLNRWWPPNNKTGISQQPIVGLYPNLKTTKRYFKWNTTVSVCTSKKKMSYPSKKWSNLFKCSSYMEDKTQSLKGKNEGNLECGSAQHSLFICIFVSESFFIILVPLG